MNKFVSRIREPVKREGAEDYVLISLLSFAATVILIRLFLKLTGYPQIGSETLHIAHVLWGGLLLFGAALLPLLFANRWVYTACGLLSGVGVGLFIDEVGKFITQTNDYFYPAAAPIIYAFFLLTVLLYVRVRRPPSRTPRTELYRALDTLEEVLDHDLDAEEHAELKQRLRYVIEHTEHPDQRRLAQALLEFASYDSLYLAPSRVTFWGRCRQRMQAFETHWIDRRRLKAVLTLSLATIALPGLIALAVAIATALAPPSPQQSGTLLETIPGLSAGPEAPIARLGLEGMASVVLLVAAGLLAMGRERRGIAVAYLGLVFSLTVVNIFVFYFDQFYATVDSLIQFALLFGILHYRHRYLVPPPQQVVPDQA